MFALILLATIGTQAPTIEVRDLKRNTSTVGPVRWRNVTGTVVNTSPKPLRAMTVTLGSSTSRIGTLNPGEKRDYSKVTGRLGLGPRN